MIKLVLLLLAGTAGGLAGARLRLPGGIIMCSMLAVIALKMALSEDIAVPGSVNLFFQIIIGVMVGASFQPEMLHHLKPIALPVVLSTLLLVGIGLLVSVLLVHFGVLDIASAYLSSSPGAMSAMLGLAVDSQANLPVVMAFHFFRVFFVILTAPVILHVLERAFIR